MADLNKVDPLSTTSRIGHAGDKDVTPSSFLIRQWQLIRTFVNGVATNIAVLAAAVARIDATTITGVGALGGGGAIGSGNLQITHDNSAVTPGSYTNADITVDAQGHVTAAANGSAPAGVAWALLHTFDWGASPVAAATQDVTGYTDIMVVTVGVTHSIAAIMRCTLSVDGGATFYTTSGDYVNLASSGAATGTIALSPAGNTTTVNARSGNLSLYGIDVNNAAKVIEGNTQADQQFVGSLAPITTLRFSNSAAGNMNGGTTYVFAR